MTFPDEMRAIVREEVRAALAEYLGALAAHPRAVPAIKPSAKPTKRRGDHTLRVVASYFSLTLAEMRRSKGRASNPYKTRARAVAVVLLREAGFSYPECGLLLGCGHTNALHLGRKVQADDDDLARVRALLDTP